MQLNWSVDCEGICELIRERVWHEGLPWLKGIKLFCDAFGLDEDTADDILKGKKVIRGINEGELVEDNKFQEYKEYLDRVDKENRRIAIQEDMEIHPLNYVDPFSTFYSYWAFEKMHKNRADEIGDYTDTPSDVLQFFEYHRDEMTYEINDLSRKFLKGGCFGLEDREYLFRNGIIEGPVKSPEAFWDSLYSFFDKMLAEGDWLHDEDRQDILRRQNNHLAWRREKERKQNRSYVLDELVEQKIQERIALSTTGKVFDYMEDYSLLAPKHRYIPSEKMSCYGIITPDGDFYACDMACHKVAAYKLCIQKGIVKVEPSDYEYTWGYGDDDCDQAKDRLFQLGYTFVNTVGHPGLYNKWDMDYEAMPQKVIDACFDWLHWNKEEKD